MRTLVILLALTLATGRPAVASIDLEYVDDHFRTLTRWAWVLIGPAELPLARAAAAELLEEGRDVDSPLERGDALHHGYLIRGRVALLQGDLAGARRALRQAGRVPSSTRLEALGPNMTLAKELLERGEAGVVLEFLGTCAGLWTSPHALIEPWIDAIASGGIPDFGANLSY